MPYEEERDVNATLYVSVFLPLFLLFVQRARIRSVIVRRIVARKNQKEKRTMFELAQTMIGKQCIIYTINNQLVGVIREVSPGAIRLEHKSHIELVNLDFVVRIREYPKSKRTKDGSLNPWK